MEKLLFWCSLIGLISCSSHGDNEGGGEAQNKSESVNTKEAASPTKDGEECRDPAEDCEEVERACKEAYCDEWNRCAIRDREDGSEVEGWSEYEDCVYADECAETAAAVQRSRKVCRDGGVEKEVEYQECPERETDGERVSEGEWQECRATRVDGGACKEISERFLNDVKKRKGSGL